MQPLQFVPLFRRYIWGGRRLATILGKPIGDQPCAESWEIVDHNEAQSQVKYGEFAGKPLAELIRSHGPDLLGDSVFQMINNPGVPQQLRGRFPLLLKFLDANRNLSVQVHPDDRQGATLSIPDFGKTEAWYVMHADPGSKIYAGLKDGVTRTDFESAISDGTIENLLHSFAPAAGDTIFIRAGTLHAIGAGLLIAEIQQASDTTFRVFDWNRIDTDGQPRELHIEQSLAATDFRLGPVNPVTTKPTEFGNAQTLIECDKFVMRKWKFDHPIVLDDNRLHLIAVTAGQVAVSGDPGGQDLKIGNTILIPSICRNVQITPHVDAEILDIFLPE